MKQVTDRKLVAASRALLALADCDDLNDRSWTVCLEQVERDGLTSWAGIDLDANRPTTERCTRMANILSRMLTTGDDS